MTGPNNLHTLLSFLLAILHYAWPVLGGTNRTIDDQWGDSVTGILPTYLPANDTWQQGANCSSCYSRPNASLAYDGSWHDVSYIPGGPAPMVARFTFDGTAIYVYCILDNHSNYTTLTNLTFRLDNETVGSYVHTPNALSPVFQYGVPVYSNTSIPNGAHTFELETDASDNGSVILFDYLQYTFEEYIQSSRSSSHHRAAAIAGGAVAAIAITSIGISLAVYVIRRRRVREMDKADISPFVVHSSSDATNHPTSLTSVPILVSSFTPSSRKTRLYTSQTENEPSQPSLRDTVDPSLVSATSPAGTRNPQSPEWTSRIDSLQEQMDRLIEEQLVLTREVHHVIAPPTYDGHSQE